MKYFTIYFILGLIISGCHRQDPDDERKKILQTEISEKINLAVKENVNDSIKNLIVTIHENSENLILLTKDIENLTSNLKRANNYFDSLSRKLYMNSDLSLQAQSQMNGDEIECVLLENEVLAINQILLANKITFSLSSAR